GSHGCSAHNLMRQAILGATLELIERRAVVLWWQGKLPASRLPEDLLASLKVTSLLDAARAGAKECRDTTLFYLNYPGPVLVVAASSCDQEGSQIALAFAAGLELAATAQRAVLEVLSVEVETTDLAYARHSGAAVERQSRRGLVAARQRAFETSHRDLLPSKPDGSLGSFDPKISIADLLGSYAARGETILLADLTRADIGLPTCRAFFENRDLQPHFPGEFDLSPL
ncbi:YcaO-like family protein, partial [Pseudophaeobacter sp.]|uniref:YcaO-like family protein n=1 Tax=Pseudophaeobacter sp. TaxID=1971739 RepID=UPI003297F3B9